jgi:hypothetical protein
MGSGELGTAPPATLHTPSHACMPTEVQPHALYIREYVASEFHLFPQPVSKQWLAVHLQSDPKTKQTVGKCMQQVSTDKKH